MCVMCVMCVQVTRCAVKEMWAALGRGCLSHCPTGSGFRVSGLGLGRDYLSHCPTGSGFRVSLIVRQVQGLGFRV